MPGTAAAVTHRHTAADMALARGALLRRADLGPGWSQASPAGKPAPLTCSQFQPATAGVVETGSASSPTFQQSSSGPFVADSAYVYASAAEERAYWDKVMRPGLLRCVAAALTQGSGSGLRFTVTAKQRLTLPKLPSSAAGYRVSGTASGSGQTIDVYLDMVVLGRGRAISAISLSTFSQPVDRRLELRLARLAANRLAH